MKYEAQLLIMNEKTHKKEWVSMKPTHREPYKFETYEKAWEMLNMCYPDGTKEDFRVIEVKE